MRLSLSAKCGKQIVSQLQTALDFKAEYSPAAFQQLRDEAFSCRTYEEFRTAYLKSECFSKWGEGSTDLAAAALDSFRETERGLVVVDRWLRHPSFSYLMGVRPGLIAKARGIVSKILGRFSIEEMMLSCDWSSGASTEFKRRRSQVENKWVLSTQLTAGLLPYYRTFQAGMACPVETVVRQVRGNRVTTVPKSYKTDRTIAIEPTWNMFFQKGIGGMIRRRLRQFGQLHPDAQNSARNLARIGSESGLLATLDLSSASDSISVALVEMLLPDDWLCHLMATRSQVGEVQGEIHPYMKISSMGNGYTFELETLLFYALACAHAGLGNKWCHVYGDDIIVTSDLAMPLAETLAEVGFDLNIDKSFWEGPFRESCGGHYWNGRDVTPFYLKSTPRHVGALITLQNKVLGWLGTGGRCEPDEFGPLLNRIRRLTPRDFWGPDGEAGTLWTHWDKARPKWSRRYQCWSSFRLEKYLGHGDEPMEQELGSYLQTLWKGIGRTEKEHADYLLDREDVRYRKVRLLTYRTRWNDPAV